MDTETDKHPFEPELPIITEFLAECGYQGLDVTPRVVLAACRDAVERLGLTEVYFAYRAARAD